MSKRLFIVAEGPLPGGGVLNQGAYGLRTWQFLSVLSEFKNWTVRIILIDKRINYAECPSFDRWEANKFFSCPVELFRVEKGKGLQKFLQSEITSFSPDYCLAVNNFASFCASQLNFDAPFWADLNGWLMAESQSAAFANAHNGFIPELLKRETSVLQRADKFSTVSFRQKDALMGELALMKRLNMQTEGYEFAAAVPNTNEIKLQKGDFNLNLPEGSQAVLFSGSYNTWLNVDLLFQAFEMALERNPKLYFVSTGGQNQNEKNPVLNKFLSLIASSKHKDRYVFLGWLNYSDLLSLYSQVSAAINIDRDNVESYFGARNRINEWVANHVPVISTTKSEVTNFFKEKNALIPLEGVEAQELVNVLCSLNEAQLELMAKTANELQKEFFASELIMANLVDWLKGGSAAPDRDVKISGGFWAKLHYKIKKDGLLLTLKLIWKRLR